MAGSMFAPLFLGAAIQAAGAAPHPLTGEQARAVNAQAQARALNAPVEPVRRAAPLSTEQAERLPVRDLADRSFEQLSDAVVAAGRPGNLAGGVSLYSLDFLLQPTGASIGGLCRSTEVIVHFGRERGPGTAPGGPENRATPRRADDVTSRPLFKVAGPLHRLKSVEAEYAWDAACAARRDVKSFMATSLPDENSLVPALIAIQHAIEQRRRAMGDKAEFYQLPPSVGGNQRLFALENLASVLGTVDRDRIAWLEVIFAPGGTDYGFGAKVTIHDIAWQWPALGSPDYGIPTVTIGSVTVEPHQTIYD